MRDIISLSKKQAEKIAEMAFTKKKTLLKILIYINTALLAKNF